jgi:DNA-binding MarR family transcriptional regulator
MNRMKNKNQKITENIERLFKMKNDQDKRCSKIGREYILQSSEISLLYCMGSNPGKSVTALAEILQITKGAVSQTLKKIETKEMVLRDKDPTNASRALISLSTRGRFVLQKHQDHHRVLMNGYNRYLDKLSSRDARIISDFLDQYESSLELVVK